MKYREHPPACLFGVLLAALVPAIPGLGTEKSAATIDFSRQVRPILAENCFACHGPDAKQRKARLRFDRKEAALAELRAGRHAIVPGDLAKSTLVSRISSTDEDEMMPPPDTGKKLSPAQVETLRQWIAEGAEWKEHWTYVRPERPELPAVTKSDWPRTPVDRFILARLEKAGLAPSPEASRTTLARRLSLDVLGLPPTPEEVDTFLADGGTDAHAEQIERLLRSPHYGERMAIFWLDLVRFADTRGYHSDNPRNVSPYRDYIIRAFNENLPFNQFAIEQLAGDLLPDASLDQRVASCYNKLNQTTEEGGAQAKEYEAKTTADRVRNVSEVWMGATLGCAECHEHKFDPYETKDFYSLAAFFADIQEKAIGDRDQGIAVPTATQTAALDALAKRLAPARNALDHPAAEVVARLTRAQSEWEETTLAKIALGLGPWHVIGPFVAADPAAAFATSYPPEKGIDLAARYPDGKDGTLRWRREEGWTDDTVHNTLRGDNAATYLYRTIESGSNGSLTLSLGSNDTIRVWINGESVLAKEVYRVAAADQEKISVSLRAGPNQLLMKITNSGGGYGFYFKAIPEDGVPDDVRAILKLPAPQRRDEQKSRMAAHYRSIAPLLEKERKLVETIEQEKAALEKSLHRCLVSVSGPPRVVRVLPRGNWMDTSGPVVEPAIPAYFGTLETDGRRASRLDFARWLVSRDNPLTARVFVNRLWRLLFGTGISQRLGDLGAMGELPVHPELLDWLAVEFLESGWDVKHMVRLMLLSSTYRQSSVPTSELRERDPYNRLLGRQSRWRVDAEMVRDGALAISGLLSRTIGGPSVRPYQPAGYWAHLNFPKRTWVADTGKEAYRRGLYTWWQRSFLNPTLMAFDAPNREECTAQRPRSNIPQQALVLLNDPTYVEAARVLAHRIIVEGGTTTPERIRWAFRRTVSRQPEDGEIEVLSALHDKHRESYRKDPTAAKALVAVGQSPVASNVDAAELAAWSSVARALLNLHETVTRN